MDPRALETLIATEKRGSVWKVKRLEKGRVGLTCPGCGRKAVVMRKEWADAMSTTVMRPCPYCWKLSSVPWLDAEKILKKAFEEKPAAKKKRAKKN